MDNKITKSRLSNLFEYEWILIIVIIASLILGWELIYTVSSVKLTTGQKFNYYYDYNISTENALSFDNLLNNKKTFSFDVLQKSYISLTNDARYLKVWQTSYEGDIIFTDTVLSETETSSPHGYCRLHSLVDEYSIYSMEKLLIDAQNYLSSFLLEGKSELLYENMDSNKIANHFLSRMKTDNRFLSDSEKENGIMQEKERIKQLCKEVSDYIIVLSHNEIFYTYTKYEQYYYFPETEETEDYYEQLYNKEINEGRENAKYGIRIDKLNNNPERFFKLNNHNNSKNVVLCVFDYLQYQPDLQFETISFINCVIRECSTILPV